MGTKIVGTGRRFRGAHGKCGETQHLQKPESQASNPIFSHKVTNHSHHSLSLFFSKNIYIYSVSIYIVLRVWFPKIINK